MEPTQDQAPDVTAPTTSDGHTDTDHYTGVVVIHGLGDEQRNAILLDAVNALTYWFNHMAGLALRPAGSGRIWLSTQLGEESNPDDPASRATIELEAPATSQEIPSRPLRLRFREVWWAQSFGTQSFGTTIRWARVQFSEQMSHILVPVNWVRGRHRGTSNATTGSTVHTANDRPDHGAPSGVRRMRPLLRAALAVYTVIQYAWKIVQWLVLTPFVALVLLLMAVLRVLSFIGIIRSALAATFSALSGYVMLHWIASTEVYMRDYARAATIRERFEREYYAFLGDDRCDRIVVIAHSMGTVIAYEGLTLPPPQPNAQNHDKPITFICLAQALRRVWLLPGIDVRRLRGTLPAHVRWVNFWARYDPIPAGPLSARSLPRLEPSPDHTALDADADLCASLERCQNKPVVNTDSSFTDHITYWSNFEQVVGPIAHELVAGHPAMERYVASRLATRDTVLLRRWDVAWRYSLGLAGGLVAAVGVLVWLILRPGIAESVAGLVRLVNWSGLVVSLCPICKPITSLPPSHLPSTVQDFSHYFALGYVLTRFDTLAVLIAAALVLAAGTLGMQIVGRAVAKPSPVKVQRVAAASPGGSRRVFVLSALTLLLALATSLVFTAFVGKQITIGPNSAGAAILAFLLLLSLAELAAGVAFWIAAFEMVANRQWTWIAWMFLALLLLYTDDAFYRSALFAVAIAGCVIILFRLLRTHQPGWYWAVGVQMIIIVYLGFGTLGADIGVTGPTAPGTGTYVDLVLPAFVYGLWSFALERGFFRAHARGAGRAILALAAIFLALVYALALSRLGATLVIFPGHSLSLTPSHHLSRTAAPLGTLFLADPRAIAAALIAVLALAFSLGDAARHRRWGWLMAMLLGVGALGAWFILLRMLVGVGPVLPDDALAFSLVPLTAALIYAVWAGARVSKPAET